MKMNKEHEAGMICFTTIIKKYYSYKNSTGV